MKKQEFLEELRNSLEGKLSDTDIEEITSDYNDVFENAAAGGKNEEQAAEELGSPARIVRTILEESARAASFQKPGADAKYAPFMDRLAPMGTRLGAFLVDELIMAALILLLLLVSISLPAIVSNVTGHASGGWLDGSAMTAIVLMLLLLIIGGFNVLTAIFVWVTDGYTPGKWLFKIRVVKLNGEKITFMEAIMREFLIKSIASGMTTGLLNVFSFIWGCVSDVNKTVQDLVTDTTVIRDGRK